MVATLTLTVLLAASLVVANPVRPSHPRRLVEALEHRGYAKDADLLEPYEQYHSRYLKWGCEYEHGRPFFDRPCIFIQGQVYLDINVLHLSRVLPPQAEDRHHTIPFPLFGRMR